MMLRFETAREVPLLTKVNDPAQDRSFAARLVGPMMRRQNAHGLDSLLQSGCRPAVEDAFEILDVD